MSDTVTLRQAGLLTSGLSWRLGQVPLNRELVFLASLAPPGQKHENTSEHIQDSKL